MIAIDPGASGGIIQELEDGSILTFPMPETHKEITDACAPRYALTDQILAAPTPVAYIEQLVKYTGRNMPSSSMATYASNWGLIMGALLVYRYKIIEVPPKLWQKALGLGTAKGMSKTEWKNKLKGLAQKLYPNLTVTLKTADALLILEAAKRGALG
jgi:hypothetical protein